MATAQKESDSKICDTCTPKRITAITSCRGCNQHFCRQHFNKHRDQLSECLNNHIQLHNEIAQDLKARVDRSAHDQLNNDWVKKLLLQIDEWESRTIDDCHRVANEARSSVRELFDKTEENDAFSQRLTSFATELQEQQQAENFIEPDLDRWMGQLKALQNDINQPIGFCTDIDVETRPIDWNETIKICRSSNAEKTVKHYVVVGGKKGVGKTAFVYYVANFFEGKHTFTCRLESQTIELNKKQIFINSKCSEKKYVIDQYSFPIDDQTVLVFLDVPEPETNDDKIKSLRALLSITELAGAVMIIDGKYSEDGTDWQNVKLKDVFDASEEFRESRNRCKQVSVIFVNCSTRILGVTSGRSLSYENATFYFMQNSAYQLYRSRTLTDSAETDYHRSMQTIKQIIDKITDGIQQPK